MTHEEMSRNRPEPARKGASASTDEVTNDLVAAQGEWLDRLQNINRRWAERLRVEAALGAEMTTQLTSSRSFSETTNAIQNWTTKHMEMATDDARHLIADSQEIMEAGTRFWTSAGRSLKPGEGRGQMS